MSADLAAALESHVAAPVYVARAIADALADRARAAHRYVDEWSRLAWAHVPVEHIRAALDTETVDPSEPLAAIDDWSERGLLACCGTVGTGKTFAAALWALARVRAGRSVWWISAAAWSALNLDAQRVIENAATRAGGLVIDDIGAGMTQGTGFRKRCEGMVIERADRPTIVLGNTNALEMEAWLDARLVSRMGRDVVYVETADRRPRRDETLEDCKVCEGACEYSPRWHEARRIVDEIGVREDERWDRDRGELVPWLSVGHNLERVSRVPGELKRVRQRYGLDQAEIVAAAAKIERMTEELGSTLKARIAALASAKTVDNLARALACYDARNKMKDRSRGVPDKSTYRLPAAGLWPESGTDTNTKLRALGFRVRSRAGRFEVRKVLLDEHGKPRKRDRDDLGQFMLDGDGDDRDGWSAANRLAAL